MAITAASSIYELEVNGETYIINGGDPALMQKVQEWEASVEDLRVPEDGKITVEKYEKQESFVRALLGPEDFEGIFNGHRDVFLMMQLVMELSPIFSDIMERAAELSEQIIESRILD